MGVQFGVRFISSGEVAVLPSRERAEAYARVWSQLGFPAELVTRLRPTAAWKHVCLCGPDSTHDQVHACQAAPCDGRELMRASLRAEYTASTAVRAACELSAVGGGSR